ncbi:MAG: aminotransferase class IV [Planctomycetes bacterium]|nr:aminotransferase class IV [Planctomycetota bacterium]
MTEVWIDGAFTAAGRAAVPSLTGREEGLFETILVRGGVPVLLAEHLERLIAAAGATPGLVPPDREALAPACRELPRRARVTLGRLRVLLVPDRVAVTCEPFEGYPRALYRQGATALLAPASGHPLGDRAGRKVLPYTPLLEARECAQRQGAIEVLFHAADGALLEGSASHLFVVRDGVIATPPLARGILPGVVRGAVLALARRLDFAAVERDVRIGELAGAEEAFLSGSLMEVLPLNRVGQVEVPRGPIGPCLRVALRAEFG